MPKVPRDSPTALSGKVLTTRALTRRALRSVFYAALADHAPHVLENLEQACVREEPAAATTIEVCVQRWAKRHRLAQDWLIEDVIDAVSAVPVFGRLRLKPLRRADDDVTVTLVARDGTPIGARPLSAARFVVRIDETFTWNPTKVPRDDWKRSVLKELDRALDAKLDRIEEMAHTAGADTDEKRKIERHMGWLVRRVVSKTITAQDIADDAGLTPRAVEVALTELSKWIDLPIPRRRPGPRKTPRARTVKVAAARQ